MTPELHRLTSVGFSGMVPVAPQASTALTDALTGIDEGLCQGRGLYAVSKEILRTKAQNHLSTVPRPFLKWAGSKRALLQYIIEVLPANFRVYREPFLGSGALFFLLQPRHAVLSDVCGELIETFRAVRDDPETISQWLLQRKPDRELFYKIRASRSSDAITVAAEFLYLNKTCWNGLYRVNGQGQFNVPYGAPRTDSLVDAENLLACSQALHSPDVTLRCCDFEASLEQAQAGDLAFLDPPYVTGHSNNGFVDYNETLFSWEDQLRLARVAHDLADRGVHVVVTNADHKEIVHLYEGFQVKVFERASTLSGDASKRRRVSESIIYRTARG